MKFQSILSAFLLLAPFGASGENDFPLEEMADPISLFQLRQRFSECKSRGEGPTNQTLYAKATLELVTRIQQILNELIVEYNVYEVPVGKGFTAWDYVFSSNVWYLIYKKRDNKAINQRTYDDYKTRTMDFYKVGLENVSREFRYTLKRLKLPMPNFEPTSEGVAMGNVGCTSLGAIVSFLEASKPLVDANSFNIRTMRDFREEWGVE